MPFYRATVARDPSGTVTMGGHSSKVLREIGYEESEIDTLISAGVIAQTES